MEFRVNHSRHVLCIVISISIIEGLIALTWLYKKWNLGVYYKVYYVKKT